MNVAVWMQIRKLFKVNNDTFTFFMRILPDPLFNYVNSAERHLSWLISLCSMWWQRILWSKFSCTILPFNHTHQFQSQLDLAVPISSTSTFWQMRVGLLGTLYKSSKARGGWDFFSWVSLGRLPWPSGAAKNEETAKDCEREQKSVFFTAKNGPAVILSLPGPKWHLKRTFPHFSLVREQRGVVRFLFQSQSQTL